MCEALEFDPFDAAVDFHQAGDLDRAEELYQQVLKFVPEHSDALHLLGVLLFQRGRSDAGAQLMQRAIAIKPAAAYYGNLGMVFAAMGRMNEALDSYLKAITLRPDFAEAHNNLAGALRATGRLEQAIESYRQAIALRPTFAEAHNNLGLALRDADRLSDAIACFTRAVGLRPNYAQARNNLGNALIDAGDIDRAAAELRHTIAIDPNYAEAHSNLGNALHRQGRQPEAIAAFRKALAINPTLAEAHNNLGVILNDAGQRQAAIICYSEALVHRSEYADAWYNLAIALHEEGDGAKAIEACRRAIGVNPKWPQAYNNLGIWLAETGGADDALSAFDEAIALDAKYAEAHSNRGNALRQLGRLDQAVESYQRATALRPGYAEAFNNLGNTLKQANRMTEAIDAFVAALELQPDLAEAHNNLANVLKDQGMVNEAVARYERAAALSPTDAAIDSNRVYTLYFHPLYGPEQILSEHVGWNERHGAPLRDRIVPHSNKPFPRRKLRIGYVSPDFREHCQAMFTIPLLSNHDHDRFEIHCYSDTAAPDAITSRLQTYADVWRNIAGLGDEQAADMIREDQIDILIDLTAHMSHNRLLLFARKPAPVQATWLAYPGTTGLSAMDYRLSDAHLETPTSDRHYSERTIRLPDSFWCYDPLCQTPDVNPLPALSNGFITFGCLNNFCKVNEGTIRLWAKAMGDVTNSRLLLLAPQGAARQRVLDQLQSQGVAEDRVDFVGRLPRAQYLEQHHRIDIALDTFPYNGHTTSLDGFWMGVPVITMPGATAVGRGGWSQLCNLDLREWAAGSEAEFIALAQRMASNLDSLSRLRQSLRDRLLHSPLCDGPRFARGFEAAFLAMWQRWSEESRPGAERTGRLGQRDGGLALQSLRPRRPRRIIRPGPVSVSLAGPTPRPPAGRTLQDLSGSSVPE